MTSSEILKAVLSVVTVILTAFVIPWLKAKQGTEKVRTATAQFESYVAIAEKVVDAAYQVFSTNDERKTFAVSTLKAMGIPENTIETVIESAVKTAKIAGTAIDEVKTVESAADSTINS